MKKSFLFLQGPYSPFFAKLGEQLVAEGHRVLRINFNSRDRFFWKGENAADYKHPLAEFGTYINNVSRLRKITDMVIYTDSSAINRAAIDALKNLKIRLYVFDKGMFDENWVTLEERIFGNKTILPKDPRFYLRHAEVPLCGVRKFGSRARAANLHGLHYKLFGKSAGFSGDNSFAKAKRVKTAVKPAQRSYFLADYDLSRKASFMRNFAANAPEDDILVFYSMQGVSQMQMAKIEEFATKYNIAGRVQVIGGTEFRPLVKRARGYITNNNMEALVGLQKGTPVLALADTIYNIEGLTSRLALADFWNRPQKPDAEIFRKFKSYVIAKTQLNACFYNKNGINAAVGGSLQKILGKEIAPTSEAEVFDAS